LSLRPPVPPSQLRATQSRPVSVQQTFAAGSGRTRSRELLLQLLTLLLLPLPPISTRRLMSCSVVEEFDATSAGVFSRARGTRRVRGSTALIKARRESVLLERPASGTPGSGAEAERVLSENASPPRSFLAPSTILSSPPPHALRGTSQRRQHLLGSQLASAPLTSATLTSARKRGESCQDRLQQADQLQGGQPDERQQQQREEQLGHQSPQKSHEGSQDCLAGRISTQTLLDFSATPAAPSSTRTRSATSSTGRQSRKCKPASQTRLV